jgi:hypothetical protein
MNKHFKIAAVALALVTAPLTYNTVFAQSGGKPSTSRTGTERGVSINRISLLNLETVKNAVLGNLKAQLSEAVKASKLTQAQADQRLTQAAAQANFGLNSGRGGGKPGGRGGKR